MNQEHRIIGKLTVQVLRKATEEFESTITALGVENNCDVELVRLGGSPYLEYDAYISGYYRNVQRVVDTLQQWRPE